MPQKYVTKKYHDKTIQVIFQTSSQIIKKLKKENLEKAKLLEYIKKATKTHRLKELEEHNKRLKLTNEKIKSLEEELDRSKSSREIICDQESKNDIDRFVKGFYSNLTPEEKLAAEKMAEQAGKDWFEQEYLT